MQAMNGAVTALAKRAPWPAIVAAYAIFVQQVWRIAVTYWALDNNLVVDAARLLHKGHSPYESKRFLYPPSSVPFALLETPFSDHTLMRVVPYVLGAAILVGWWAALRMFGIGLSSWLGVAGIAAAGLFKPSYLVLVNANWTAIVVALAGVAFLLMSRDKWALAGVVIGLSIAVKPMLIPLGLLFLLARRWWGFLAAAGIPIALSAAVLPLLPRPGLFFSQTVPFLLHGQDAFSKPYDSSLLAVLPRLGVGGTLITVLRGVLLIVTFVLAVLRWRQGGDERLRIVETAAALMLGTFLVLSPTFLYYPLLIIPVLVASIAVPGSIARSIWFWLATVLLFDDFARIWLLDYGSHTPNAYMQAYKGTAWILAIGLLLVIKVWPRKAPVARTADPDSTQVIPRQVAPPDLYRSRS